MLEHDRFLSPESRRRLEALRTAATAARAIKLDLTERQRDNSTEKMRLLGEFDRLKRWQVGRRPDPATDREIAKVDAALAELQVRADDVNGRLAALGTATVALVGRCERFIKTLRSPCAAARQVKLDLRKGESLGDAVTRFRALLAELKADRREIEAAPRTSAEAKQIIASQIDELARLGEPDSLSVLEAGHITWPRIVTDNRTRGDAGGLPGTLHVLAWLARDLLTEKLCQAVTELADDRHALSSADRSRRLAENTERSLMTERQIAEAIWAASAAGISIEFESDADVRAVLALHDDVVEG